jgi:hypothetical protein
MNKYHQLSFLIKLIDIVREKKHIWNTFYFFIREMQGFFLLNFLHFNSKVKNKKYDIYITTQLYYVSKPMAPDLGN